MSFAIVARSIRGVSVGAVALVCSLSAVSASAEGKHDRNEGLDSIEHEFAVDERQLTFKLVATPEKAGRHTIHAVLKTSVCDDKQCILKSEKLTLHVLAK